jgi:hypothetical protein
MEEKADEKPLEEKTFSDPNIPAAFEAMKKPFKIYPQRNDSNSQLVEFCVRGRGIDAALEEVYANASVGVLDFIRSLKMLRSAIYTLKGSTR